MSDLNPYFPVPPCEHGGTVGALLKGVSQTVLNHL
jgi:hypothetical protein